MEMIHKQKFLAISLFVIIFGILITNLISEDTAIVFASWSYVVTAGSVVVLALIIINKTRGIGSHGKAWILFAVMAISWFVAEQLWNVYELILDIDPWPSEADFFWIFGYLFYFGFMMFYLKPFRKAISKKMILLSSLIALGLLVPSLYISYNSESDPYDMENILGLTYPVLDSIVIAPAIIGFSLFLTGKVNFLWTAMCLAIFCAIIADAGFLFTTLEETYYSGHPIEILYHWSYILFAFGIYGHYKIFRLKKTKVQKENPSLSGDKMRIDYRYDVKVNCSKFVKF